MSEAFRLSTKLMDLAALRDAPTSAALQREILPEPATRQGQREIVAAIIAAAVITSEAKPVTIEEAVERMAVVFEGMERHRAGGK